jgi:hypothetical protein
MAVKSAEAERDALRKLLQEARKYVLRDSSNLDFRIDALLKKEGGDGSQ